MKEIFEHKVSKIAGIIIMIITIINAGIAPVIVSNIIEFIEFFGLTLIIAGCIVAVDASIANNKTMKKPSKCITGTVTLNW